MTSPNCMLPAINCAHLSFFSHPKVSQSTSLSVRSRCRSFAQLPRRKTSFTPCVTAHHHAEVLSWCVVFYC